MIHAQKAREDYNNKTKLHFHFRIFLFNVEKYYYGKTNISGRYIQYMWETLNDTGRLNNIRTKEGFAHFPNGMQNTYNKLSP